MKAMILAAGRGERMRPLTDHTPKPLLLVNDQPLIAYNLIKLANIGVREIVINVSYMAELIIKTLGDGSQYGVRITYSHEAAALETGGGIYQALPLLGIEPFIVMNADIWIDYPLQNLPQQLTSLAHLILVDSPSHNTHGDFYLNHDKVSLTVPKAFQVTTRRKRSRGAECTDEYMSTETSLQHSRNLKGEGYGDKKFTYAGLGVYHPDLFQACQAGMFRLADVLKIAIAKNQVSGEYFAGDWIDVGTPERLECLQKKLQR
jgi:MurNAc alpha-1-phosphate uridylyltransferase